MDLWCLILLSLDILLMSGMIYILIWRRTSALASLVTNSTEPGGIYRKYTAILGRLNLKFDTIKKERRSQITKVSV